MGNFNLQTDKRSTTASDDARAHELQGSELNSSTRKNLAIGAKDESECDANSELHLDGDAEIKADTLYRDGLDIDEDYDTLAGTRGSSGTIP